MTRLLAYTGALMMMMMAILATVRIIGSLSPSPGVALFASQQCTPEPCWLGIQPGVTTLEQAGQFIRQPAEAFGPEDYRTTFCWQPLPARYGGCAYSSESSKPLARLALIPGNGKLTLGNAVVLFGEPLTSRLCGRAASSGMYITASVRFRNGVSVSVSRWPDWNRFDPDMNVSVVVYAPDKSVPDGLRWEGFTRQQRLDTCSS